MFKQLFIYRIKMIFRSKSLLFWSLVFPIILSIFFKMAFSKLETIDIIEPFNVGIVTTSNIKDEADFIEIIDNVRVEDKKILKVKEYSKKEANKALKNNKISGYYLVNEEKPKLVILQNGTNQTILAQILHKYLAITKTVEIAAKEDPQVLSHLKLEDLTEQKSYTKKVNYSHNAPNPVTIFFYSLIGMAIMFGMNWGIKNSDSIQPNQSPQGMRVGMNPNSRMLIVLSNLIASFVLFFAEMLLFLAFLHYVLKIDFGNRWGYIVLTCLFSCLLSISLGSFLGSVIKGKYQMKSVITQLVAVFGGFLSGMMGPSVKYLIDKNAPILSYINPTNLVTDSLYKLYYYSSLTPFYVNMAVMIVFIIVLNILNYISLRRETYASL